MNVEEFGTWINDSTPALKAWGRHVVATVTKLVKEEIGDDRFDTFFKIPPSSRVKKVDSALKKLLKKRYDDPVQKMTDLVGARFVVLVKTDIAVVEHAVARYTDWTISRERDPTYEVSIDPKIFDYQSVHYLVRSREEQILDGVPVPAQTTCEVQIRTLLQHAYAELVHDNVYKAEGVVPTSTKRLVARCMALMETTDDMFCEALKDLKHVNTERETWLHVLDSEYRIAAGTDKVSLNKEESSEFVDIYRDLLQSADRQALIADELRPAIYGLIRRRAQPDNLFGKPLCLLVYWLLTHHPDETIERWPFMHLQKDFEDVMADLGVAHG